MLGHWVAGTNDSTTKPLLLNFFFHNYLQDSLQKTFQFISYFLIKRIKNFECPKSIRNYEKNNAWKNIRPLVDESFGTQQPSVFYWRLSDFKCISPWIQNLYFYVSAAYKLPVVKRFLFSSCLPYSFFRLDQARTTRIYLNSVWSSNPGLVLALLVLWYI